MTTADLKQLEADLWRSADTLRANSDLKASEYSTPVLGSGAEVGGVSFDFLASRLKLRGGESWLIRVFNWR